MYEKTTHLGNLANVIFVLGSAYEKWNLFQWKEAANLLSKTRSFDTENSPVQPELIEKQSGFCKRLAEGELDNARLVDLLANAKRCFTDSRYDDCTSRLYRAFEYAVQIQLREKHKINTSKFEWKACSDKLHENIRKKYEKKGETIKLGLREGIELIAELGDEMGIYLIKLCQTDWTSGMEKFDKTKSGPLQNALNKRNDSFLAHGTRPISQEDAKSLLDAFEQFLEYYLDEDEFQTMLNTATFVQLRVASFVTVHGMLQTSGHELDGEWSDGDGSGGVQYQTEDCPNCPI